MSQHDYDLANAAGAAFRADLNTALGAIATNNSGASEPATTYAYQWWADTTSGWLKQRNAANSGWIKRLPLGTDARVDVASAATLDLDANAANSSYLRITGTTTITAVTLTDGQQRLALAGGAFVLTHGASLVLPGAANYTTTAGDLILFIGEATGVVRVMVWKGDGTSLSSLMLRSDTTTTLAVGYSATPYNAGTKSSGTYTPDEANGNLQYATNGGAHTLAPPTNNCSIVIQYTNNGSAGAITTSGFTKVSGSFTTTNGDDFMCYVMKLNGFSHLNIVALQ